MKRTYDALIKYIGTTGCAIDFINTNYVQGSLKEAFGDQAKVTVEIKSRRKPRSLPQNNLFHAYCGIIASETGNGLDVVKSTLKAMYCQKPFLDGDGNEVVNEKTGEVLGYIQDTRDLSTIEMAELTESTRLFAAEWFGIELPLPDEQIDFKFKK